MDGNVGSSSNLTSSHIVVGGNPIQSTFSVMQKVTDFSNKYSRLSRILIQKNGELDSEYTLQLIQQVVSDIKKIFDNFGVAVIKDETLFVKNRKKKILYDLFLTTLLELQQYTILGSLDSNIAIGILGKNNLAKIHIPGIEEGSQELGNIQSQIQHVIDKFEIVFFQKYDSAKQKSEIQILAQEIETLEEKIATLQQEKKILAQKAYTDGLTQIGNRDTFVEMLEEYVSLKQNNSESQISYMAMLDIDHFKKVNDTYGHQMGDQVLVEVMNLVQTLVYQFYDLDSSNDTHGVSGFQSDIRISRIGGEEFGLFIRSSTRDKIEELVDRILDKISKKIFYYTDSHTSEVKSFSVTVSMGLLEIGDSQLTATHLMKYTDIALYAAKNQGRDRYIWYTQELMGTTQKPISVISDTSDRRENRSLINEEPSS